MALLDGQRPRRVGLFATDLDRTLTDARLRPVPSALREIDRLRRLGVPVVLATGRTQSEVEERTPLHRFDHVILEGGALVGPPGRLTRQPGLRRVAGLSLWLDSHGIRHRPGVASLSVAAESESRVRPAARARRLQVQRNGERLDVTAVGVSKGSALRGLRRRLRPVGAVIAAGDGENDLDLFEASHFRVAVANAHPRLRAAADEVTAKAGGVGLARFLAGRIVEGTA